MNVALIGATGRAGTAIRAELLRRGHGVTAIARHAATADLEPGVRAVDADIFDAAGLAKALRGHDAVISAAWFWPDSSRPLVNAVKLSGVRRALFVGGASSLDSGDGRMLIDVLEMPDDWMPAIREGVRLLEILRGTDDLDWTFVSPPLEIGPGPRRGTYRTDPDRLVTDESGRSSISFDDYAIAMVDALENAACLRGRFGVGY